MKTISVLLLFCGAALADNAPAVLNIQVLHHDGQTFITWTDAAPGAAGANYRYNVYRSLNPITDAASLSAATLIQAGVFNNSGQMAGQFPFNQTTRQDSGRPMAIVQAGDCRSSGAYSICGTPLVPFTGLAVHTAAAQEAAYYAVVTTDLKRSQSNSPIVPGQNATVVAVAETPADRLPLKYYDSHDSGNRPQVSSTGITGKSGLPLFVKLHASGGGKGSLAFGDQYIYWGDSTMGYQEGIQRTFTVYENHTSGSPYYQQSLMLSPSDTVWTSDGLGQLETFWFGYLGVPLGAADSTPRVLPSTEAELQWMVNWTIANYNVDPNRVYGSGYSMGGWGNATWALRHPEIFAAIFPAMPNWRPNRLPDMIKKTTDNIKGAGPMMADGSTSYQVRVDSVAFVRDHCSQTLPFIAWGVGRQDPTELWQDHVDMVNALKACRLGFAFSWNNGFHPDGNAAAAVSQRDYLTKFAKNLSYPAFANSSIDDRLGSGDPADGDLTGCINCGFDWTNVSETDTTWTATISNSRNQSTMTVDVTPRNLQTLRFGSGRTVVWTSSQGQSGTVVSDDYGLVIAPGIIIQAGTPTTVTFTLVSNPAAKLKRQLGGLLPGMAIAVRGLLRSEGRYFEL